MVCRPACVLQTRLWYAFRHLLSLVVGRGQGNIAISVQFTAKSCLVSASSSQQMTRVKVASVKHLIATIALHDVICTQSAGSGTH